MRTCLDEMKNVRWLVGIMKFNRAGDFRGYSHILTNKLRFQSYVDTLIPMNYVVRGMEHEEVALVFLRHSMAKMFIDLLEDPPEDIVVIPFNEND